MNNEKEIKEILQEKKLLCIKRDNLGNKYNELIELLIKYENNPDKYSFYVEKIKELEPPARETKENLRVLNRRLNALGYSQEEI